MIPLSDYLVVSALLFVISIFGIVINRNNLIVLLMCTELMLLSVSTNFIAFAQYLDHIGGEVFVFFILTVAAAESAIGLAILVLLYRKRQSVSANDLTGLKG